MTEAELISAAIAGDQGAWTALYEQHQHRVVVVVQMMLRFKGRGYVEDVAQNVWLKVYKALPKFAGESTFATWANRIAVNECLGFMRRARQPSNGDAHLVSVDAMAPDDSWFSYHDDALSHVAVRLDIDKLLGTLKPRDRQVLELAYLEGLPIEQVAEAIGLSVGGTKSKLFNAKRRARDGGRQHRIGPRLLGMLA